MKILIATQNPHKAREIKAILKGPLHRKGIRLASLKQFHNLPRIKETGLTYRANALKKARVLTRLTGLPVLAEDSGLEVFALNNQPGIYSARYAGPNADAWKNNQKLLKALVGLPASRRGARYRCVAVYACPRRNKIITMPHRQVAEEATTEGTCYGTIADKPCGNKGFGYDPIFMPRGKNKTFGQLPATVKNRISHRAKAFNKMVKHLLSYR